LVAIGLVIVDRRLGKWRRSAWTELRTDMIEIEQTFAGGDAPATSEAQEDEPSGPA
jgi:hypothetical protein